MSAESAKAFDPKVVDVLQKRYLHLEKLVEDQFGHEVASKLSTDMKVERGLAPAGVEYVDGCKRAGRRYDVRCLAAG